MIWRINFTHSTLLPKQTIEQITSSQIKFARLKPQVFEPKCAKVTLETGTLEEILPDAPGGQWESQSAAPGVWVDAGVSSTPSCCPKATEL